VSSTPFCGLAEKMRGDGIVMCFETRHRELQLIIRCDFSSSQAAHELYAGWQQV
jgi:hypothetical protein